GGEDNITVVIAQYSGAGISEPIPDSVEPQNLARSPDTPTEINWGLGATTDPLGGASAQLADPPVDHGIRETEPLLTPPTESTPFTAKLQRSTTDLQPRTNDLSDRRGPITAVFGPEEIEDELSATAPQEAGAPAIGRTSAATEPLGQRQTEPL